MWYATEKNADVTTVGVVKIDKPIYLRWIDCPNDTLQVPTVLATSCTPSTSGIDDFWTTTISCFFVTWLQEIRSIQPPRSKTNVATKNASKNMLLFMGDFHSGAIYNICPNSSILNPLKISSLWCLISTCTDNISGQIIISYQPRFPWNKGIFLP